MISDNYDIPFVKKINKFKWSSYDKIRSITNIEPVDYLQNAIKTLINEQDEKMVSEKYINCLGKIQIKLSHRLLLFFDILHQINIESNNILSVLPYFRFKKKNIFEKTEFIYAYSLHMCKEVKYKNIIIHDIDLESSDKYNMAYSAKSLSVLKIDNFDFIYIEFVRKKNDMTEKNYLKNFFDDFSGIFDLIMNNISINGNCLILISHVTFELIKFLELIINKNIFTSYKIVSSKYVSVLSYLSRAKFILLTNFTGNKINFNNLNKAYNKYDFNLNIRELTKSLDLNIYNTFERINADIISIYDEKILKEYIYNNILEYCNNIEIFIGSKYVNKRKINIWKHIFGRQKVSKILYNTDNDTNVFFTYIYEKILSSNGLIYIIDLNKSKIDKTITNIKFIDEEYINKIESESIDIIFITNNNNDKSIKELFFNITNRWNLLKKDGLFVFDNLNEIYINYKTAYDYFEKMFFNEYNVQYIDFSQIIIKKIL